MGPSSQLRPQLVKVGGRGAEDCGLLRREVVEEGPGADPGAPRDLVRGHVVETGLLDEVECGTVDGAPGLALLAVP
jgi:hypothetical protein